jgi:uncharacterized protein (TIGR01777 family)
MMAPLKVTVAGGTGFLGSALVTQLKTEGHEVTVLTRRPRTPGDVEWTPDGTAGGWARAIDGADAVVNLAGESIAGGYWTADRKQRIDESRMNATRSIVAAIKAAARKPEVLLNASAIGYYGSRGGEALTEDATAGTDFLATVCNQWEWEAQAAQSMTRVVLLRTGLVLHRAGGALPAIARPFAFFAGGPVGSGNQYWSWIHRDDWLAMTTWALGHEQTAGPLNLTAPAPVTNREFAATLGSVLKRPARIHTPAFVLRLVLGEMADALLLGGQFVLPFKAEWGGYHFQHPTLRGALEAIYA